MIGAPTHQTDRHQNRGQQPKHRRFVQSFEPHDLHNMLRRFKSHLTVY